ncbi:MAG: hypothetical protein HRU23_11015 [Gammaproteobacteria bacterium]|nr:hypothetical protein [Gammaproteobacteria bacterium]
MIETQLHQLLELSAQIKAIFVTFDITIDNTKSLEQAGKLIAQRDRDTRKFFTLYSPEQLTEFSSLLNDLVKDDLALQVISSELKSKMSKQIIQQKRKTKATQAYIKDNS